MASVLRRPTLDPDQVHAAHPPLLVDPDWQALLDATAERAYQDGRARGRAEGEQAAVDAAERAAASLQVALEEARTEVRRAAHESAQNLLSTALELVGELAGRLPVDPERLIARLKDALSELDGDHLQVLVAPDDGPLVRGALTSDSRVEVVDDPALRPGEARITGEWCEADLRWEAVLGVLGEVLDA